MEKNQVESTTFYFNKNPNHFVPAYVRVCECVCVCG